MMPLDFVDLVLLGLSRVPRDSEEFVRQPKHFVSPNGQSLSFASPQDLVRGALHYVGARRRNDFRSAADLLAKAVQTIEVERISLTFVQLLYDRLVVALPKAAGAPLGDMLLSLYAEYAGRPVTDIVATLQGAADKFGRAWLSECGDEEALTPERLKRFYESREFPLACSFRRLLGDNLQVARAALPLLVAKQVRPEAAFDFGGNSGLMTTALAAAGVKRSLLLDCSRPLIDFARWRDRRMGLMSIEYLETDHACDLPEALAGAFDFGICTEVLEHVWDVEAAVRAVAKLLKKDGILFQSTSFGHYPYPTHLRRNVVYAGREDELMARFGLERTKMRFQGPLRANERIYRKVA